MSTQTDSVHELLTAVRRTQILDAATKVFAEKGYHRATIKDVSRAAGIADGTIYKYFDNKMDVLLGILNRLNETEQRADHFAASAEGDFRHFLTSYLRHRLSIILPNQDIFQAVLPELLTNSELRTTYYEQIIKPSVALAEQFLRSQIEAGQFRQMDVPLTVRTIAGSLLGILMFRMLGDDQLQERWEDLPEVLADLILNGLKPDNINQIHHDKEES
jgi:AcrR family transcriptional regulator